MRRGPAAPYGGRASLFPSSLRSDLNPERRQASLPHPLLRYPCPSWDSRLIRPGVDAESCGCFGLRVFLGLVLTAEQDPRSLSKQRGAVVPALEDLRELG